MDNETLTDVRAHHGLKNVRQRPPNMAENGSLVTVSGAALSLLLYENVRSLGDQIGFLVGEVVVFVTKNVTDSDRQIERIQTHIEVNTIITCPTTNWLCNGVGQVDRERLKDFIHDKRKDIVGWFRFRKNESLIPTLQDKILHKELSSFLFSTGTQNQLFTMCLLNTSTSNRGGTHKFRHVFLRYKNGTFEPIPLRINNLRDDSTRLDGSDYKPTPLHKSSSEADAFARIINSLDLDLKKTPGTELVTSIQKAAEHHLDDLIPQLSASDREVAHLENKVRQLQTQILAKKLSNRTTERKSLCTTKLNTQKEKNEQEREKKKEETKMSTVRLKNELIDMFSKDCDLPIRNQATLQKQLSHSNKPKSLVIQAQKSVNVNSKIVNQDNGEENSEHGALKSNTDKVQDPFAAAVAVMKMDMGERSPNKDRRSQSREPSSSPQFVVSVHRSERNDSNSTPGIGRGGSGRGFGCRSALSDSNVGSKKARRGKPKVAAEKCNAASPSTEQDKPKVVAKLEFPVTPLSYSQAARKANDTNSIRSDSQEY